VAQALQPTLDGGSARARPYAPALDEAVRRAVEAGVRLAIDSDAHQPEQLAYADTFGVAVARRGWASEADVVNALPVAKCLAALKRARRGRRR
jgi:histidinol phosphatase-like PHP family hydrolase